jgi:hypothetical protein
MTAAQRRINVGAGRKTDSDRRTCEFASKHYWQREMAVNEGTSQRFPKQNNVPKRDSFSRKAKFSEGITTLKNCCFLTSRLRKSFGREIGIRS